MPLHLIWGNRNNCNVIIIKWKKKLLGNLNFMAIIQEDFEVWNTSCHVQPNINHINRLIDTIFAQSKLVPNFIGFR